MSKMKIQILSTLAFAAIIFSPLVHAKRCLVLKCPKYEVEIKPRLLAPPGWKDAPYPYSLNFGIQTQFITVSSAEQSLQYRQGKYMCDVSRETFNGSIALKKDLTDYVCAPIEQGVSVRCCN